jgi:hypothetical protein
MSWRHISLQRAMLQAVRARKKQVWPATANKADIAETRISIIPPLLAF